MIDPSGPKVKFIPPKNQVYHYHKKLESEEVLPPKPNIIFTCFDYKTNSSLD